MRQGKKVMAKHKSISQKRLNLKRKKENYGQMEPAMKKRCLIDRCEKYKSMDPLKKEKLLSDKREWNNRWYSSLKP